MATKKINYKDKAPLQTKPEIPEENKVNAEDLNQIKEVVNNNADEIELRQLKEEGKGLSENDFTDALKTKLEGLSNYNDTEIKKEISEINKKVAENTENDIKQDTEIATLKNNYTKLQEQNTKLEEKIKKDRENMINLEVEGQSIHIEDSSDLEGQLEVMGNVEQDTNLYTGKLEQGTINENGEVLTTNRIRTTDFISVIAGTKIPVRANGADKFAFATYDNNKKFTSIIGAWTNIGESIAIPSNVNYIKIILGKNDDSNITVSDITNFIVGNLPNSEYPSEIRAVGDKGSVEIRKQNENFFNKNNANILNAYIGASKGNIVSGTYHRTVYLKVNKGTYTITKHKGVPGFVLGYTKTEPKLGDIVENLVNAVGKTTETISVENGYLVINIYVTSDYNANYTVEDILNGLKIELGKVSTEYTEHQEQTKILPIQKPMLEGDYFNRVDNKEVHTWKKIILDGVNNKVTQMNTNQSGKWRYEYKSDNLKNCSLSEEKAYCTHLPLIRKGETADNIVGFTVVYNGIYIYTNGETAEEFNTKLQTNNITFYIPVIESAYQKLDLTPEQTEVLDELDNFPTYKPTTNITTDSIAKLKLKYIADTKTYIDNKTSNLEQQVSVINELLSTTKTSSALLDNLQTDIEREVL